MSHAKSFVLCSFFMFVLAVETATAATSSSKNSDAKRSQLPNEPSQRRTFHPGELRKSENQSPQYAYAGADYPMRCQFESSIDRRPESDPLVASQFSDFEWESFKEEIIRKTQNVTWFKIDRQSRQRERIHRINGEQIDGLNSTSFLDKPQIILHEVGKSDIGLYVCVIHWPDLETLKYFSVPKEIYFTFVVTSPQHQLQLQQQQQQQQQHLPHNHNSIITQTPRPPLASHELQPPNTITGKSSTSLNGRHFTDMTLGQFIGTIFGFAVLIIVCFVVTIACGFKYCQTPPHEKDYPNLRTNVPYKGIIDDNNEEKNKNNNHHHVSSTTSTPNNTLSVTHKNWEVYNVGGISGHLRQSSGHHPAQSISDRMFSDKGSRNPSISSSSNQSHSDKASTSDSQGGDKTYQHPSNTTSTTVPVYDIPSSANSLGNDNHLHIISMHNSSIINDNNNDNNHHHKYGFHHLAHPDKLQYLGFETTKTASEQDVFGNDDGIVNNPLYAMVKEKETLNDRSLKRGPMIGKGNFGVVYQYQWTRVDGTYDFVAVKTLIDSENKLGSGENGKHELMNEINLMRLVNNHVNVIKILGTLDGPRLVMEFAELGNLQQYLRKCRKCWVCWSQRICELQRIEKHCPLEDKQQHQHQQQVLDQQLLLQPANLLHSCNCAGKENSKQTHNFVTSQELVKFASDIANGMKYIATHGIIHRDLASRNVLLSKDKRCKIADFGFARKLETGDAYECKDRTLVPVKWMAPEALVGNGKFTTKSDVFSFGVVLWEIVTLGATPYGNMTSQQVLDIVRSGGHLPKPDHCNEELFSIMERCWSPESNSRPTFEDLACELELMLPNRNDYILLEKYTEYYNIVDITEREKLEL